MAVPAGIVTGARGGFFQVYAEGVSRRCRARGILKRDGKKIFVGDHVDFEPIGTEEGIVAAVHERKTLLVRPPIANVDQALLVFSLVEPDIAYVLLDRLLVVVQAAGVAPVVVFSKTDLAQKEQLDQAVAMYTKTGFPVLTTNRLEGNAKTLFAPLLSQHITVFAGPSGAGKSSLANQLDERLQLSTGDVSEKLGRGRHTTRHVQLWPILENGWVADAPGFSQLDVNLPSRDIRSYYPDFLRFQEECEYRGCLHLDESDCGVERAAARGDVAPLRLFHYRQIVQDVMEREARQY